MDPSYKTLFESLSPDDRYYLEERAAIHEFDGKLPREEAEKRATGEFKADRLSRLDAGSS